MLEKVDTNNNSNNINLNLPNNNGSHSNNVIRNKLLKEYTKSEKDLQLELQQLDLARRQFEHSCKNEIQKVLIRYTNRIAKHHLYVDSKRSPFDEIDIKNISSVATANNDGFLTSSRISTATSVNTINSNKRVNIKTPNINENISNNNNNNNNNNNLITTQIQSSGIHLRKSSIKNDNNKIEKKNLNVEFDELPKIIPHSANKNTNSINNKPKILSNKNNVNKKTVSWNNDFSNLNVTKSENNFTRNLSYSNFISGSPRNTSTAIPLRRKKNDNRLSKVIDLNTNEDINQFLNTLKTTDSGFYTYLNSKGESVCAGYDNFGTLNRFNSASTASFSTPNKQLPELQNRRKSSVKKDIIKHFENMIDLKSSKRKLSKKTFEDDDEFIKSSLLFSDSFIYKKNNNENDDDMDDADKKTFEKIYRAQTTRNLTMKNVFV